MGTNKTQESLELLLASAVENSINHDWAATRIRDAAAAEAGKQTSEKRSFPLRPSSAMKSDRDLVYGLCAHYFPGSITIDPVMNPILLELGHAIEGHLVKQVERCFKVVHRNHRVTYGSIVGEGGVPIELSGELDFCIENEKGEVILCDSKSIGAFGYKKLAGPKEEHVAQLHCYLRSQWARDLGINRAMLMYYCKDNSELRIYEFTYNPAIADAIVEKFQRVHDLYLQGVIPPRQYIWGLDWQAHYSSFRTHDSKEFRVPLEQRETRNLFPQDEIELEGMSEAEKIRYIATTWGGDVVNGYYLTAGSKGLLLNHVSEKSKKYGT